MKYPTFKAIRALHGEIQETFAKRLGVTKSLLEKVECGQVPVSKKLEKKVRLYSDLSEEEFEKIKSVSVPK